MSKTKHEVTVTPMNLPVANIKGCNIRKRVAWHKNKETGEVVSGTVVVLIGYCPDTIPYFMAMAQLVLKDWPKADPAEMVCAKVTVSHYVKGYTVLLARIEGPKRKVRGWDEGEIDFNY